MVLHVRDEYDTVIESVLKTEFLTLLSFCVYLFCSLQFTVKKEGFGGGGTRNLNFHQGNADFAMLKSSGKTLNISIGPGLPSSTREYWTSWRSQADVVDPYFHAEKCVSVEPSHQQSSSGHKGIGGGKGGYGGGKPAPGGGRPAPGGGRPTPGGGRPAPGGGRPAPGGGRQRPSQNPSVNSGKVREYSHFLNPILICCS